MAPKGLYGPKGPRNEKEAPIEFEPSAWAQARRARAMGALRLDPVFAAVLMAALVGVNQVGILVDTGPYESVLTGQEAVEPRTGLRLPASAVRYGLPQADHQSAPEVQTKEHWSVIPEPRATIELYPIVLHVSEPPPPKRSNEGYE